MEKRLSKKRSNNITVFESYIKDQMSFDELMFVGPGIGGNANIYDDEGNLIVDKNGDPVLVNKNTKVQLVGKDQKIFNFNVSKKMTVKSGGNRLVFCHIKNVANAAKIFDGWCPIAWIGYKSQKLKYNKGSASEGILAAAIAARFINKTTPISPAHVKKVLDEMSITANQNSTSKIFKSKTLFSAIEDDVDLTITLSPINMMLVFPEKLLTGSDPDIVSKRTTAITDRETLISPCVAYANSREITKLARVVYMNRRKDLIKIVADGITGEKTTKVDVKLSINGRESILVPGRYSSTGTKTGVLNITQISLKREVDQFAQVGGWGKEFLEDFWGKILNIQNISTEQNFSNITNPGETDDIYQVVEFMKTFYNTAANVLSEKLNTDANWVNNRKSFINALHEFATKDERNVQMVELVGGRYVRFNFKDQEFENLLTSSNPKIDLTIEKTSTSPKSGRPQEALPVVKVSANVKTGTDKVQEGTYDLVKFRSKIEWGKKVVRNYVEKQSGLQKLIGSQ